MDEEDAVLAFGALSQVTRLDVFRLLVQHEPDGLAAGEVARHLGVPHNTLSTHLGILSRSGLVQFRRQSRSIIYRANLERVGEIASFLLSDCCGGNPAICAPVFAAIASCSSNREGV